MTLDSLRTSIHRDPASWRGMALHYVHADDPDTVTEFVAQMMADHPQALIIHHDEHHCVAIGSDLVNAANSASFIQDIASDWRAACQLIDTITDSNSAALLATRAVGPSASAGPLSILVVEDDSFVSQVILQHLRSYGAVVATENSHQAIANYMVRRPQVVFLDIHYHDDQHDGFDVLDALLSADANAFIVLCSVDRNPHTIAKALSHGAQGFIAKPILATDLSYYLTKYHQLNQVAA